MKFIGTPNLYVRFSNKYIQRATRKKGITFDADGFYETENPFLIKILSQKFETENNAPGENIRHCKKCDFACDTQGALLAHYRKEHPKE